MTDYKLVPVEGLRYTFDGALAECPCCGSLDVGGAHDTVHCQSCGLTVSRPRPLQNAIDAWNTRTARAHPAPDVQGEPVAMVDASDDGMWAEILPDVTPWEELDYSKMTRKEMAFYIGQQNFTVTALRKRIERMEVKVRNQRQALRQMRSAPDVTQLVEALEHVRYWIDRRVSAQGIVVTDALSKIDTALSAHRKGGDA